MLAVVAAAGYLIGPARHESPAAARKSVSARYLSAAPVARILSLTPKLYLALSGLREDKPTLLKSLGEMTSAPVISVDDHYLVNPYGQVVALTGAGSPSVLHNKLSFNGYQESPPSGPFADHDLYAVVLDSSVGFGSTDNPISIQALTTGRSQQLGIGDNVTGDPARPGVFTSVAAPLQPTAQANQVFPDGRVELRDAGKAPVRLATIAQLDADAHVPAGTQAALFPYADPTGGKVAITVLPTSGADRSGVVVLTRTGRLVRTFTGLSGVIAPVWSHAGKSLAFATSGPHPQLYVWNAGRRTVKVSLPTGNYGACVWSPDAAWILCPNQGVSSHGQAWELTSSDGATTVHTSGPGFPIAWLGGK